MHVLSVKGSSKNKKGYYYLAVDSKGDITFTSSFIDALQFNDPKKAYNYGIEHYMEILKAMLDIPVRLYSNTFAVRKINFKTVKLVDPNNKEIDDVKEENADALDESCNNEPGENSGVEMEMPEHVDETSSSDIQ